MSEKLVCEKCATVDPHFVCDPPPWATRIPAAIKRAKEELEGEHECERIGFSMNQVGVNTVVITATEVALADELWGFANDGPCPPWPDVLIAFTEKIESLDE